MTINFTTPMMDPSVIQFPSESYFDDPAVGPGPGPVEVEVISVCGESDTGMTVTGKIQDSGPCGTPAGCCS